MVSLFNHRRNLPSQEVPLDAKKVTKIQIIKEYLQHFSNSTM